MKPTCVSTNLPANSLLSKEITSLEDMLIRTIIQAGIEAYELDECSGSGLTGKNLADVNWDGEPAHPPSRKSRTVNNGLRRM